MHFILLLSGKIYSYKIFESRISGFFGKEIVLGSFHKNFTFFDVVNILFKFRPKKIKKLNNFF